MRALNPENRLLILYAPATLWGDILQERLQRWLTDTGEWLQRQACTLMILSHSDVDQQLRNRLISQHRALDGLASLNRQQDRAQYLVSWWGTEQGMVANQTQMLEPTAEGWLAVDDKAPLIFGDDEGRYLAENGVLEGAPPLSANWRLFADNDALAQRAMSAHASTLIFSLYNAQQVDELARWIHRLRSQRGDRMKIVVREMRPALRTSDERLLLACGANIIVGHSEPLSRFLNHLASVQGQHFARHVPADIEQLLTKMRPLEVKGYLPPDQFIRAVEQLISNALTPEGSKGLLVALYPVSGLRVAQALTICRLRRFGDIVTLAQGRLLLFLSTCGISELDTALKSIFSLPANEIFISRAVWAQDLHILSEIKTLSECREDEAVPLSGHYADKEPPQQKVQPERHQPVAITLFTGG